MSRTYKAIPPPGENVSHNVHVIRSFTEQVALADFVDGGGASGTYTMQYAIPKGALILAVELLLLEVFAGDTSAVITFGDGSDVDRYNTGTPDVFTTASPEGLDVGVPSGDEVHATAVNPVITVTSASDFTSVSSGRIIVRFVYAAAD